MSIQLANQIDALPFAKPVSSERMGALNAIASLRSRECRWPVGDPLEADFHYCCEPAETDRPYCEAHTITACDPQFYALLQRRKSVRRAA